MEFTIEPIGNIRTPYQTIDECPRNTDEEGPLCRVVLNDSLADGLFGLAPGDRIQILYWMEKATFKKLRLPSRKTGEVKGIFALRTPLRPNPVGIAEVDIVKITDNEITVRGLDCLDSTPLIDIKPARKRSGKS